MDNTKVGPGAEIKSPISIGQEFIEWAEQYWQLKELIQIDKPDKFAGETCDYNYMRRIFIEKINSLITGKLGV